jgi:hypothetical protein
MIEAGMDWARPTIAGLVGATVVALLAAIGTRSAPDKAGWRRLTPSAMHWTGLLLGTGLLVLMSYIRLFVGSIRADAETQMSILTGLIFAFALGTISVAVAMIAIRRQAVRWRGSHLFWRDGEQEQEAELSRVTRVGYNWLGRAVVGFDDGRRLAIDPYARGAQNLIDAAIVQAKR